MRLVLLTNESVSAGSEATSGFASRYRILARGLADAGHEVLLIEFRPAIVAELPEAPSKPDRFDHILVDSATDAASSSRVPAARDIARALSLLVGAKRGMAGWEREVQSLISGWQPEISIVMAPIRPEASMMVPRGMPSVVLAEEDLTSHWNRSRPRIAASRLVALRSRFVCVIGDHEVAWASRWFPRARVWVVPHAVDLDYWTPQPPEDAPRWDVLSVGDFSQERNYAGLDAIVTSLRAQGTPYPRIAVVSSGQLPAHVLNRSKGIVHVLGGRADVRPLYADARVVLVPAFAVTGVKTQVLQGWAMERPVVATAASAKSVGGVHGEHLVAGCDPGEVGEQLRRLLDNDALAQVIVEGGRDRVREHFSPDHAVEALEKVLHVAAAR